MVKGSSIDKML